MDSNRINNTINTMANHWIIPKKFLFRYALRKGALIYAVIFLIIMLAGIIVALIEMMNFKTCDDNSYSVKRSAYGFSTMAIIFCVLMIIVNLWFIWGVQKRKAPVILMWVVATSLWLVLTACLTVVLLCFYTADTTFATWILCLVFGIIAFAICLYGILVGVGLWLKLKAAQEAVNTS